MRYCAKCDKSGLRQPIARASPSECKSTYIIRNYKCDTHLIWTSINLFSNRRKSCCINHNNFPDYTLKKRPGWINQISSKIWLLQNSTISNILFKKNWFIQPDSFFPCTSGKLYFYLYLFTNIILVIRSRYYDFSANCRSFWVSRFWVFGTMCARPPWFRILINGAPRFSRKRRWLAPVKVNCGAQARETRGAKRWTRSMNSALATSLLCAVVYLRCNCDGSRSFERH